MKDLSTKTCKQLREVAKELGVKGRWDMTKKQLIEAIEASQLSDRDIIFESDCVIKGEDEIQSEGSQKVTRTAQEYLETIQEGTLVAFKRNKNKDIAMSGKFVGIENGKVIVESKKGTKYKLNLENIIWVKTGTRWPKWVFNLFSTKQKEVADDNAVS